MSAIRKKILVDDFHCPVAVQIDYADWLVLEQWLAIHPLHGFSDPALTSSPPTDPNRFAGTIRLTEDPLVFQEGLRNEWNERQ